MMTRSTGPLFLAAAAALAGCGAPAPPPGRPALAHLPACMIIDDSGPFLNIRWTKDPSVCREIPISFYEEFGEWARDRGIKGKFSVVPCPGGAAAIDGSTGEFPGHTAADRRRFIGLIQELYQPNWTITPEVITHHYAWDLAGRRMLAGPPTENVWLAGQPLAVQTAYIAEALRMLRDAGLKPEGLTMCWSYPEEKNPILGEALLRAARRVLNLDYLIVFNDTGGERPGVIYRDRDGGQVVSLRPRVGDCYDHTFGRMTEEDIRRDADRYITEDGGRGEFVEEIKKGLCLRFYTHFQTLYGNGTKTGFRVFKLAIERLHEHHGDRLQWMTGMEICRRFCPPEPTGAVSPPPAAER